MIDSQTWQRYIDNTCTADERKAVLRWLQAQDEPALEALLDQEWEAAAPPMPAAMATLLDQQLSHLLQQKQPRRLHYTRWLAAAGIALLAGSLLWLQRPAKKLTVVVHNREIANTSTYVRRVTLTDGSQLWLTPGSVITVPDNYNQQVRKVILSGEAYFEVAPQSAPFQVSAGGLEATVLGTHFNIEAYPGETTTGIALSAGKIAVRLSLHRQPDSTLILTPGLKLSYKKQAQSFNTRRFLPEKEADWKRGALVLEDVPLEAAFSRLESRYHKKILISRGNFKATRFTATYNQETLTAILHNMAFIYGFHYYETRDTVFIH
jgi:transmembrane sensor